MHMLISLYYLGSMSRLGRSKDLLQSRAFFAVKPAFLYQNRMTRADPPLLLNFIGQLMCIN